MNAFQDRRPPIVGLPTDIFDDDSDGRRYGSLRRTGVRVEQRSERVPQTGERRARRPREVSEDTAARNRTLTASRVAERGSGADLRARQSHRRSIGWAVLRPFLLAVRCAVRLLHAVVLIVGFLALLGAAALAWLMMDDANPDKVAGGVMGFVEKNGPEIDRIGAAVGLKSVFEKHEGKSGGRSP
jgi:hypothetical protein